LISESSWFGTVGAVDFDMDLEDNVEEPLPMNSIAAKRAHQLVSHAVEILNETPMYDDDNVDDLHEPVQQDYYEEQPYSGEDQCRPDDPYVVDTAQELRELPMDEEDAYVTENHFGISTTALHGGEPQDVGYNEDFSGHDSVRSLNSTRSLEQAFEDLSACMERTAQSPFHKFSPSFMPGRKKGTHQPFSRADGEGTHFAYLPICSKGNKVSDKT
ncbi:MAG: hypothetical protein SGILL_008672, partial [Bacillariaceae sp.]